MNDLREECELEYREFSSHKLILRSEEFGVSTRSNVVMPSTSPMLFGKARRYQVVEIRKVNNTFVAGCVQHIRFLYNEKNYGEKFLWFNRYDGMIKSQEDCLVFSQSFICGYQEAEEQHRQSKEN